MNIYFASDLHFGHANVIKYSNRPFDHVDEMNDTFIKNWNRIVKPNDMVYQLGDFALTNDNEIKSILSSLNGRKKAVFGNHDRSLRKHKDGWVKNFFEEISDMLEVKVEDKDALQGGIQHIVLTHYSMRVWNKSHYGSWNLYGHSHGSLEDPSHMLSMDVGVDATAKRLGCNPENYRPISYEEVKKHMMRKKWKPIDHHGNREESR